MYAKADFLQRTVKSSQLVVVEINYCWMCRWKSRPNCWKSVNRLLSDICWGCDEYSVCDDVWLDYASSWTASDPELDCVSVKVDTQKLQSKDCDTELPFACMQLPGAGGLTSRWRSSSVLYSDACSRTVFCRGSGENGWTLVEALQKTVTWWCPIIYRVGQKKWAWLFLKLSTANQFS